MASSRFNLFIRPSSEAQPRLPLLHTCEGFDFREIIASKQLNPAPCDLFGETLIYFFYGRPSYRPTKSSKAVSHPAFLPVSIAIDSTASVQPARIAPFDTGAFAKKLFADYMHPGMSVGDFLLDPTMDIPARLVERFFGRNAAYFHGEPLVVSIPPIEFEALSYYSLITSRASSDFDDRRSSIEVQTRDTVRLTGENVLLVVLPGIFLEIEEIRTVVLEEWAADVRTYTFCHSNPSEYMSRLYQEVYSYFADEGLV